MIYPVTRRCNKLVPSRRLLADCVSYLVCVCVKVFSAPVSIQRGTYVAIVVAGSRHLD